MTPRYHHNHNVSKLRNVRNAKMEFFCFIHSHPNNNLLNSADNYFCLGQNSKAYALLWTAYYKDMKRDEQIVSRFCKACILNDKIDEAKNAAVDFSKAMNKNQNVAIEFISELSCCHLITDEQRTTAVEYAKEVYSCCMPQVKELKMAMLKLYYAADSYPEFKKLAVDMEKENIMDERGWNLKMKYYVRFSNHYDANLLYRRIIRKEVTYDLSNTPAVTELFNLLISLNSFDLTYAGYYFNIACSLDVDNIESAKLFILSCKCARANKDKVLQAETCFENVLQKHLKTLKAKKMNGTYSRYGNAGHISELANIMVKWYMEYKFVVEARGFIEYLSDNNINTDEAYCTLITGCYENGMFGRAIHFYECANNEIQCNSEMKKIFNESIFRANMNSKINVQATKK